MLIITYSNCCPPQEKVLQPRETRYSFSPLETGRTEELCVRINIKDKSDKRLSLSLSESVTSDAPLTGSEVVTPARTSSSPQLAGAWASRAHVIRPPLEPRPTVDGSYPTSATSSVSSITGSVASGDNDIARPTMAGLQGAWSKAGATGAQVVSGGQQTYRMGSSGPRPHPPATPTSVHDGLRRCVSSPMFNIGGRDQRSKPQYVYMCMYLCG